jgi:hypothetical protein
MDPGVEQWIWVCDFYGFGMADINIRLARAFLSVTAEHYPERLGHFIVIDAPSAFNIVWRAVQVGRGRQCRWVEAGSAGG